MRFKCAYCGAEQSWSGTGAPVCSHCGSTQQAAQATQAPAPKRRSTFLAILAVLLIGAGASALYYKYVRHPKPASTVIAQPQKPAGPNSSATPPADAPPVGPTRIVHVDNPHIRIIPKGVQFTAQDLLDSANRPPAPPFDAKLLVIKQPRRMRDEEDNTIFVGEVTNTSPDQVAVAPVAKLTLMKNGHEVDSAEHDFPDLPPGAHVPLRFSYDGEPKPFDKMDFDWKPTQSYSATAPDRAQLTATIANQETLRGSTEINFTRVYRYNYVHITGTVANSGHAVAKNIGLYAILRDAKGDITGYEHQNVGGDIPAGGSQTFEISPVIWGGPVVKVEVIALRTSPPAL